MKINDNRTRPATYFENIKAGEIFYSEECDRFFLRTFSITDGDDDYNAIDLSDGALAFFDDNESVEKVKAELTITNP